MTNGVVIRLDRPFDNPTLPSFLAGLVKHHLGVDVTVVGKNVDISRCAEFNDNIDQTIEAPNDSPLILYLLDNLPYKNNIILDTRVVVLTNELMRLFDNEVDTVHLCPIRTYAVGGDRNIRQSVGVTNIPLRSGAIMSVNPSDTSAIFKRTLCGVYENYEYLSQLFHLGVGDIGDQCLSMASHMLREKVTPTHEQLVSGFWGVNPPIHDGVIIMESNTRGLCVLSDGSIVRPYSTLLVTDPNSIRVGE